MCRKYSRDTSKHGKNIRDVTFIISKSSRGGVTRVEIGNLLDNIKIDILSSFSIRYNEDKKKQDKVELPLSIFCYKFQKKHPLWEFSLHNVETCVICEQGHINRKCPSLLEFKVAYQHVNEGT